MRVVSGGPAGNPASPARPAAPAHAESWQQRALELFDRGQHLESLHAAIRALHGASRAAGDGGALRREAILLAGWNLQRLGRAAACRRWLAWCERCGWLARDDGEAALVRLALDHAGDHPDGLLGAVSARLLAHRAELDPLAGELCRLRGRLHLEAGDAARAAEDYECAVALFRLQGRGRELARTSAALAALHGAACAWDLAVEWLQRSLAAHEQLGLTWRMAADRQRIGAVRYLQGRYADAREQLEEAVRLAQDAAASLPLCRAHLVLGDLERDAADFTAARRHLMAAYGLAQQSALRREEALALRSLGDVLRDEGHPGPARRYFARALAIARQLAGATDLHAGLVRRDGECLALSGDAAGALPVLADALDLARAAADRIEEGVILRCRAVSLAATGADADARGQIASALELLERTGARREAALAHLAAARIVIGRVDDRMPGPGRE